MTRAHVPLPSGPPKCRYCGQEMETGFIAGESVRPMTPANLVWIDRTTGDPGNLTSAGGFAWSRSPRLDAFLCDPCGVIEVRLPPLEDSESGPETK